VCHECWSPSNLLVGSAYESFCQVVAKGGRVGVELGDVWVRHELPVGAVEDAPCVGCNVDKGDLLPSLSSACCGGDEACFDVVVLSGYYSIGHRVLYRDYEVCELSRVVLLAWERM